MTLTIPKKTVEFFCALAMIGSGVFLSGTGEAGSATVIVGSLLSVLGGALISWATVSLTTADAAADLLRPQLSAIARQLVAVSGQISKTVQDAQSGELEHSVALEMISQTSRIMYSSVNEIHVVLKEEVQIAELLGTAQRVDDLASQLAGNSASIPKDIETDFKEAMTDLRKQVQRVVSTSTESNTKKNKPIPKAAAHELQTVFVECPECQTGNSFKIGPAPGSSASPLCGECNLLFHAHRLKDGSVATKAPRNRSIETS